MATAPKNYYVVIIAGGVGTRLWPKSRKSLPKQFFHLNGEESLANLTYHRLSGFIADDHVYVVAPEYYENLIKKELPKIPEENYIFEPEKKGTTAANAISAMLIKKRDPGAIIHFLVADDYLTDYRRFHEMSLAAHDAASDGSIIVFGVKPAYPNPGFGHIKVGKKIDAQKGVDVFTTDKFVEKPDEKKARRYFSSGKYYVHGSGFAASAASMLEILKKDKANGKVITELDDLIQSGKSLRSDDFKNVFSKFEDIPIEYSLLEKAPNSKLVTLQEEWNDVGAWNQVYDIMPKDKQQNVILGDPSKIIVRNSFQNLIFASDRVIAVTDLKGMVIVDTNDAVLVCPMPDAQNVKKIVEILKEKKLNQYI